MSETTDAQLREAAGGFFAAAFYPDGDGCTDEMRQTYSYWHKRLRAELLRAGGAMEYESAKGVALSATSVDALRAALAECYEWLFESKSDGPRVSEGALTNGSYTREYHALHDTLKPLLIDSAGVAKGEDDQDWDARAEQATADALGVVGINPAATSVDELFTGPAPQPAEGEGAEREQ